DKYSTSRAVAVGVANAAGSFRGTTYGAAGEGGYDIKLKAATVTPFLGLAVTEAHTDAFVETGSSGALRVNAVDSNSVTSTVGLRASTEVAIGSFTLVPEGRLAWQHEFGDAAQKISAALATTPGSVFTVTGASFGRDSALVGAGLTHAIGQSATVFLDYDGRLNSSFSEHAFSAGFRIKF
ncbi:MAG TPA: autotransporter outer membrane beta-barrel domain-containing protein, partial [Stellaceae bacterium]|nr:autotransporter outer membrane beta-barrel domain-containing protein [Stellaceae bacterium]